MQIAGQGPKYRLGCIFGAGTSQRTLYGNLNVLIVLTNADLMMSEELVKKTGAGNLFIVFGEPDIDIDRTDDGKVMMKIKDETRPESGDR